MGTKRKAWAILSKRVHNTANHPKKTCNQLLIIMGIPTFVPNTESYIIYINLLYSTIMITDDMDIY